ncbi:ABC transporter permease [Fibrisoma montanum]|uniref:ABC transporter permease n=1 Tax=Fibrisoma montanum TaxID=2305895 RepID=A0A418MDN2_9BACT|nr:ABC transporter permease [Fibrisoma montanum]RIV24892.1 ABC transporter permease [Fibrisoma montanum]
MKPVNQPPRNRTGGPDHPPRWAQRLLRWLHPSNTLEEVEGDLDELYAYWHQRAGEPHATLRYLLNVLSVLPPFVRRRQQINQYPQPSLFHPDMLRNYFTIALRNLWRNKLYSSLNLTGLAVGLAASALILLWVQNELSFDSYHPAADRTYRVTNTLKISGDPWVWSNSPLKLGETAQREVPGIERITRFKTPWQAPNFQVGNDLYSEDKAVFIDSTWFKVFDYNFLVGNQEKALDDPNSVVLTETKARTWFGNPEAAVGKIVRMDSTNLVVRAVVRDNRPNSSFRYDVLMPIGVSLQNANARANEQDWNNFNYQLFLQLNAGAKPEKISQQLTQLYRVHKLDSSITASLIPLRDIHFNTSFQNDVLPKGQRKTVMTLGLVGLLILIIASINYVNLATALTSQRAKEVGVKKIIGAGRGRLFAQFLSESVLLTLLALGLALGLIGLSLRLFNHFTDNQFRLDLGNTMLWLFLLGSVGLTVLLSGVYPSLLLSSLEPVKVLKGSNVLNSRNTGFRQGLVVVQFTISIALIVTTLIISRQLHYVQTQDPGYQREHIFMFQVPFEDGRNTVSIRSLIKQQLRDLSGVAGVTSANQPIVDMKSMHSGSLKWAGKRDDFKPTVSQFSVEPETRSVFNLKLTQGRWFSRDMKLDTANVILNETAVKSLGLKAPVVGQWFEFQSRRGRIIGITKDFNFQSFHQKIEPMVLFYAPSWQSHIFAKTAPGTTPKVLAKAERIWQTQFPGKPFKYTFLDESFNRLYQAEQKAGQLFNVFASITILLSCLGLFGLATFSAERRTKEIGVRKVLGASVTSIVSLLSKDFLRLVIIAIVLATPIAWYLMNQWLQDFAYKIDIEWWVFALAGLLAIGIALLTVSFQSIKAALTNPVKSLRAE